MNKSEVHNYFVQNRERFLAEWREFLKFKSISTDPLYHQECLDCATWLVTHLQSLGLKTELLETSSKPVVYAEWQGEKTKPQVIFYGHYDVQPVDPVEAWSSDPFGGELRGDRVYARGAQDNKGQVFYYIKALQFLMEKGALGCSVKLFIEGEEESLSTGIAAALPTWGEKVKGDILMVCDTGMYRAGLPAITMGLRGMVACTATLKGPRTDLHSGVHGGVVLNPATEMARLLSSLHHADGSIAVEGYYADVRPASEREIKLAEQNGLDIKRYEESVGVPAVGGEHSYGPYERRGFRPTLEINGIHSGYGGPGTKTIIPSVATAKLSSRLAKGQNPKKALKLLSDHLMEHTPPGLTLEITDCDTGCEAVRVSPDSPIVKKAAEVLEQLGEDGISYIWEGASIPIISEFVKHSGAEPLLVGFGLEEDSIHAPNESFSLEQFEQGFLYVALFLEQVTK
ncbi:MAG: M20/M25/M40 family metallo-hydrolase [Bdellovibrionales bacterium]|nr:M20/M25/M40 family metallo-hydrolase [Bdellovibrionales bacterium]